MPFRSTSAENHQETIFNELEKLVIMVRHFEGLFFERLINIVCLLIRLDEAVFGPCIT